MRLSCITSKFVLVVLETSMYFSGIGNDSSLGEWNLTLGSTWWRYMKFPHMEQKSFIASPASGSESWGKRPFWFSQKVPLTFSSNWVLPYKGGCSQFLISSRQFDSSICGSNNEFSIFLGKYFLLCIESFGVDFWCVHRFQLLKVCNQKDTLPNSRVQSVSKEQSK